MSDELMKDGSLGLQAEAFFNDPIFKIAFNGSLAMAINDMISGGKSPDELANLQAKITAYGEIKGEIANMIENGKRAEAELKRLEETRNG